MVFLQCAHPVALILIPIVMGIVWWRYYYYKEVRYRYPLTSDLATKSVHKKHPRALILWAIRFGLLLLLTILVSQVQWVDSRSKITVDGIDIMLVIDVSDSMNLPHHQDDTRSRIEVAQIEAARFIDERAHDAIGVVIFGNDSVSRCPLTADKIMLKQVISTVDRSGISRDGTVLSTALLTAINRLKHSVAHSKIIILLTDGEPTRNDIDPRTPLAAAQQLGIKIYTVGIGSEQELLIQHPVWGYVPVQTRLNKELLTTLAQETGGTFFEVKNAADMRTMYETINALEKTNMEAPIFAHYQEYYMPFLVLALIGVALELIITTLLWFGL